MGKNLATYRGFSANKKTFDEWFQLYEEILAKNEIEDPHRIWNADETGMVDVPKPKVVVGPKGGQAFVKTPSDRGTTSTYIAAVSAAGDKLDPFVIFPGSRIMQTWRDTQPEETEMAATKSGYVNKETFTRFGHGFVDHLKKEGLLDGEKKTLLLLDGHYAHLFNLEFLLLMKKNKIIVLAFPPHTSHKIQPLDLVVFGILKRAWNRLLHKLLKRIGGRKLTREEWWMIFLLCVGEALTVRNIQAGFRVAGVFPVDRFAISDESLAPSNTSNLGNRYLKRLLFLLVLCLVFGFCYIYLSIYLFFRIKLRCITHY